MNKVTIETADTSGRLAFVTEGATLAKASGLAYTLMQSVSVLHSMEEISRITGGYVQILPEWSYMPALVGVDNEPVFLYRIIEGVDEYLDIRNIVKDFPSLNYSQIAGAISFLKKVSQINSRNIDIDELEDEFEINNPEFRAALERAYSDKEVSRVLPQPE